MVDILRSRKDKRKDKVIINLIVLLGADVNYK